MIIPPTGVEVLGMTRFTAKIGMENAPSLRMFGKIGFQEVISTIRVE